MYKDCMRGSLNPKNIYDVWKYKIDDFRKNPFHFRVFGTCIFCGIQGSGKTLSGVQYVLKVCDLYKRAILVTNTAILSRPFNTELIFDDEGVHLVYKGIIEINTEWILNHADDDDFEPVTLEYTGLDMLKYVNNNEYGVLYFIDELHLELNSLESKNIDIEVMVEISQQRKQRKHIVGTSQVFMRLAKPLREQIHDIVLCKCILSCIQWNTWIDGTTAIEENGKLKADTKGHFLWFHSPELYSQYDTYTKMRRYNQEWQGRKRIDIYSKEAEYVEFSK